MVLHLLDLRRKVSIILGVHQMEKSHIDHHELFKVRVLVLVESAVRQRHDSGGGSCSVPQWLLYTLLYRPSESSTSSIVREVVPRVRYD